jgi:predicted cupin superfamily sugar epimerase
MTTAQDWIKRLSLQPHPEGGFFSETYRSSESIARSALPARFFGDRSISTGIYFLIPKGTFSALHRIKANEMWHFYDGGGLNIHCIDESGHHIRKLGLDWESGYQPQFVIKSGVWFGAEPAGDAPYALVGCTVAPGFDFADFEMAERERLLSAYPEHADVIRRMTR